MRFAPYLAEVSFAFDKVPYPYTEMALHWSNTGLEALPPAHLQYIPPGLNTPLPVSLQKTSPVVKFLNLPDNQAVKATLTATFSNGDVLENAFVDILFSAFLARFAIKYIAYQDEATGKQILAAQLSWQIDPLLINRVDHYTLQSPMVCGNQALQIRYEAAYIIHSLLPGEIVPVTLSAIGFDGAALGALSLNLYIPTLKLIPTRANVSGIGYGKQMDRNGIQEIYQVNHNQTIAQMTLPTQQHATETRSLGAPLALMDPATVVSGTAREYVNAFDPNDHNQAFDYSTAKAAGAKIASRSTASFNQQHQGNYTFNHEGTLNQATTIENYSELTEASQINNTIENYNGTYSGETFSKTVNDYYEQVDTETLNINEHHLEAPVYEENTGQLQEQINHYNVNAQSIHFEGDHFIHNGTLFLEGKFDLGWSGGYQPKPFVLPKKTPSQQAIDTDYQGFVATVYAETNKSRVLMSAPNVRYASGALLYYWYVSDQKSYQEVLSIIQNYTSMMNSNNAIHSIFDTGYYNSAEFPKRSVQDDTFTKKAVASVIVNRANGNYYKYKVYQTAKKPMRPNGDIWKAYTDTYDNNKYPEFNGYGSKNYIYAMNIMQKMKNNYDINSIADEEVKNLYSMLWNVFYKRQVTTDANLYFSPIAQVETVGHFQNWSLTIEDFKGESNSINNHQQLQKLKPYWRNIWLNKNIEIISDDFAFFSIPEGLLLKSH